MASLNRCVFLVSTHSTHSPPDFSLECFLSNPLVSSISLLILWILFEQNKTPISSSCSPLSLKRHSESLKLSSVRSERNDRVLMESSLKDSVLELDPVSAVNDGVLDFYGEVMPMEDQGVTPWTVSVAR